MGDDSLQIDGFSRATAEFAESTNAIVSRAGI